MTHIETNLRVLSDEQLIHVFEKEDWYWYAILDCFSCIPESRYFFLELCFCIDYTLLLQAKQEPPGGND